MTRQNLICSPDNDGTADYTTEVTAYVDIDSDHKNIQPRFLPLLMPTTPRAFQ